MSNPAESIMKTVESLGGTDNTGTVTTRQPSTERPTLLLMELFPNSTDTGDAEIQVDLDFDNDGVNEVTFISFNPGGLGTEETEVYLAYLPTDGTYSISYPSDPSGSNTAFVQELEL